MTARENPKPNDASAEIARLMTVDDSAFLRDAYLLALGRRADRDGETFYGSRLAAGEQRLNILKELALSDEGRAHLAGTPDAASAIARATDDVVGSTNSIAGLLRLTDTDFVDTSMRLLLDQGADVATRSMMLTRLRGLGAGGRDIRLRSQR